MNSKRLEQLKQFVEEEPDDPFNIYALALEYLEFDVKKTLELFNQLLTRHEAYLPTYYHAGKLYIEFNKIQKAQEVLEKGIALAKAQHDDKSLRELQSVLDELL